MSGNQTRTERIKFLGFIARVEFETAQSIAFELLEQHSENTHSLRGWLDIHYPCEGLHALHIRACLDPEIVQFATHENYSGEPSEKTESLIEEITRETCKFLNLPSSVSWHVDLQARGVGTMRQSPNYFL